MYLAIEFSMTASPCYMGNDDMPLRQRTGLNKNTLSESRPDPNANALLKTQDELAHFATLSVLTLANRPISQNTRSSLPNCGGH
jgi:hypothetical protein